MIANPSDAYIETPIVVECVVSSNCRWMCVVEVGFAVAVGGRGRSMKNEDDDRRDETDWQARGAHTKERYSNLVSNAFIVCCSSALLFSCFLY